MNKHLIEILDKAVILYNERASEENKLDLYDIFDEIDRMDENELIIAINNILAKIK